MTQHIVGKERAAPADLYWDLVYEDGSLYLCTKITDRKGDHIDLYVLEITDRGLYAVEDGNPWTRSEEAFIVGSTRCP